MTVNGSVRFLWDEWVRDHGLCASTARRTTEPPRARQVRWAERKLATAGLALFAVVAFARDQQADVDGWMPLLRSIAQRRPDVRVYELPTLARSLGTGGVNGGLSPLYQVGGPRSVQLALRLNF